MPAAYSRRSRSTASRSRSPPSCRSSVPRLAVQIGLVRQWAHTTVRSCAACWAYRTLHSTHCGVTVLFEEDLSMTNHIVKTLVIQHGTLIDGSGRPAVANEAIVVEGNRIRSVGRLPEDVRLEDQDHVQVIDAAEHWIMPGLIDGHGHLSFGFPQMAKVPS